MMYYFDIRRTLSVTSTIMTKEYGEKEVKWEQELSHNDNGTYINGGFEQLNDITTMDSDTATGSTPYEYTCTYPMAADAGISTTSEGSTALFSTITRSENTTLREVVFTPASEAVCYG